MSKLGTYVAFTEEVDDGKLAVQDILGQIPLDALKKNTIGIVACHYEFGFSDVLESIAQALPFDIVGTISSSQGTAQDAGNFLLVLTVLTSDEVEFCTVLSEPLVGDTRKIVRDVYEDALGQLGSDPDLIFFHAPFMLQNNGDDYLAELNEVSQNAPLFGTLAVDDTADFRYCFSIYNGKTYNDCLAITLLKGIEPKFYSANISSNKIVGDAALITASEGALLSEVNDRPIFNYLEEFGLATLAGNGYAMATTPFILDYGDGTPPISRIFIQLTPDGKAILNGSVPIGAELKLGSFDKEDAHKTAGETIQEVLSDIKEADDKPAVLLLYSCIGRAMALGADYLAEIEQAQGLIGNTTPFMMAYSGGEYCPTEVANGRAVNRFHNNALIICSL